MKTLDNFFVALGIGLVLPIIFGLTFFAIFCRIQMPLFEALDLYMHTAPSLISKLMLVACVPNLFGVFVFYHIQWWKACRGFLIPIVLYLAAAMFFI